MSASVHAGILLPPDQTPTPQEQTPPPGADTLPGADPLGADTPRADPPGADTPRKQTPPPEADSGIRSMSGRYASYWNAFL